MTQLASTAVDNDTLVQALESVQGMSPFEPFVLVGVRVPGSCLVLNPSLIASWLGTTLAEVGAVERLGWGVDAARSFVRDGDLIQWALAFYRDSNAWVVYRDAVDGSAHETSLRPGTRYLNRSELTWQALEGVGEGDPNRRTPDEIRLDAEPPSEMGGGKTQLMFWAAEGAENHVRTLIQRGVDVDAVDDDGDPALYYAVSNGRATVVQVLLESGADPNAGGANGVPIRVAAGRGWTGMVQRLVSYGARVDARSQVQGTRGGHSRHGRCGSRARRVPSSTPSVRRGS